VKVVGLYVSPARFPNSQGIFLIELSLEAEQNPSKSSSVKMYLELLYYKTTKLLWIVRL